MFVRTLEDVRAAGRVLSMHEGATESARYLTAADGMGFSFHVNRVRVCPAHPLWYKHHWEANHILSGLVRITDETTDAAWDLGPGDLYQVFSGHRRNKEPALVLCIHKALACQTVQGFAKCRHAG